MNTATRDALAREVMAENRPRLLETIRIIQAAIAKEAK